MTGLKTEHIPHSADPPPPPPVATAGKNHLKEEITPLLPTGIGELYSQTQNHFKFRTGSVLAPMWTPPINESAEPTLGALLLIHYSGAYPNAIALHARGVTKRCRLSCWPIAPSYLSPSQMRGEGGICGVSANEYNYAHGAQINFWDLTPYLTSVLRIRDVYPGYRIRLFSIPDPNCFHPGSASKNLSILTLKNGF